MATPKNPPVTVRILGGTRIRGEDPGEMIGLHPDGCGGPIVDLKADEAADLVSSRRAEVIPRDRVDSAKAQWESALKKKAAEEKKAAE